MPKTRINNCTIHYQQLGQGPDLILIHGLFGNLAFWYFSILPELLQHFRVCMYDMRGHGHSDRPKCGYRSAEMAEDLRGLMDHLGIERAHIAGHSFGGAVALHFAAHYPQRLLSLTLADAWIPGLQPSLPHRNSESWREHRARLMQAGVSIPEDLPIVAYSIFDELSRDSAVRSEREQAALGFSESATRQWSQLVRGTSVASEVMDAGDLTRASIRQITIPVLAIFGQYSHCLPTFHALRDSLCNYQAALVPGVGHLHPLLRPAYFAQTLMRFASRQPSCSRPGEHGTSLCAGKDVH